MEPRDLNPARWLKGRVIYPVLIIVAACFAAAAAIVLFLAAEIDDGEHLHARRFTETAINDRLAQLERTIVDYAGWGELYDRLHKRVDLDWAYGSDNLGAGLFESFGYDILLLLDPEGREVYTVVGGVLSDTTLAGTIDEGLDRLVGRARVAPEDESVAVSGLARMGSDPVLLSAAAISTGGDPAVAPIAGPRSVLVFGRRLTPARLAEMGNAIFVRDLQAVHGSRAEADGPALVMPAADGEAAWTFRWTPDARGQILADRVLPVLAVTGILVATVVTSLLRQAFRASLAAARAGAALVDAHTDAEYRALHDATTGLANRLHLTRFLDRRLAGADASMALLFIDLDRFKPVNDSLGHQAGDAVLREVARRLRLMAPADGVVARVGGDEFVLAAPGFGHDTAARLGARIVETISEPIDLDGSEVTIGASVGIARSPADATDSGELVRKADIALYEAKNDGRGVFRFFTPEMNEAILERRRLETDLRRAVRSGEFVLHFQPRVDARTLRLTGLEALVRWQHPERGLLPPSAFIGLAEEIGLIIPLGEWVLEEACATVAPYPDLAVSVNVSPAQFIAEGLPQMVATALKRTGLPATRLELELTESVLLEDTVRARRTLDALKRLGVRLSMDDFGTGYSSIGYLRSFPFDAIKIDRQFVGDLGKEGDARSIIQAIVGLGRALDLDVVAEGVETTDQLLLLRTDQCREVQGFLTGAPMPADALRRYLAEQAGTTAGAGPSAPDVESRSIA
jgi:diguanylate cyclase (GGDEF)-like protein